MRALDRRGNKVEFDLEGYPARVAQHEVDHLDGVLFIDRMTSVESLCLLDEVLEVLDRRLTTAAQSSSPQHRCLSFCFHVGSRRGRLPQLLARIRRSIPEANMRRFGIFLVLVVACLASQPMGSGGQSPSPAGPSAELRQQLAAFDTGVSDPVTVIVELAEQPAAVSAGRGPDRLSVRQNQLNRIRVERGNVFSHFRRLGIKVSPHLQFELAYNGFVMTLPANQLPLLVTVPGVIGIYPNEEMAGESIAGTVEVNVRPELANSVPAIGAPAAWSAGYRGAGMRIAMIDDGLDYTHPDLGGCLGPGCKVIAGYDFIDLDADPQEGYTAGVRDSHGTHTASIAAGAKGVAPDANIVAARVLGEGGRSYLSAVMAGIEFAMQHDVDVMSMSIGITNTTAQSTSPYAAMTGNVVASGVVWVNSNGNDGASGPYRPNMYGSSPFVMAAGNADARPTGYPRTTVVATGQVLVGGAYVTPFPPELLGMAQTIIDVGYGNFPAAYAGKDVTGKIVIASRGGSGAPGEDNSFVNKGNQAIAAGAAGLIISNNVAGDFTPVALPLPSFTVSLANGAIIRANPVVVIETFNPGPQIASGSSRGPTTDLLIKPDVAAPGTSIVAAVPFEASATGYAAMSGTSMAAPHVAGSALLLRQAHPDWTPEQVKLALMNTATNLQTLTGLNYRTIEQGAGFINVARALNPALVVGPGSISFGQLGPESGYMGTRTLEVSSTGTYDVAIQWVRSYSDVSATTTVPQVAPGQQTVGLSVAIQPAAASGEYEGYVTLTNTSNSADVYRVPFLFVHRLPVSQFQLSKSFARSSNSVPDTVDVTFSVGQQLADWYLGSSSNTKFTANQGAAAPGTKTLTWNVKTPTGGTLVGMWSIGVWYKLQGSTTFVWGNAYGRLYIDNLAPAVALDPGIPALTNQPEVVVRGAVLDLASSTSATLGAMSSFGEAGGAVFVNGQQANLYPRTPAQLFTAYANELAFEAKVLLHEGSNVISVYAQDATGNRLAVPTEFTVVLDSIAPTITFSGARTYTVDELVEVSCAATDSGSGVASTTCGTAPLLQTEAWRLPLGPTTVQASATDFAGNTSTATATVTVAVTYQSLASLTTRFKAGALGQSMLAQLGASQSAAARGNLTAARNALAAYQREVLAQSGKVLTAEQASTLVRLSSALMP